MDAHLSEETMEGYKWKTSDCYISMTAKDFYEEFKNWQVATAYPLPFDVDSKKLGTNISKSFLAYVKKGEHRSNGDDKLFNITQLKHHFNIGVCMVDTTTIEPEETADNTSEQSDGLIEVEIDDVTYYTMDEEFGYIYETKEDFYTDTHCGKLEDGIPTFSTNY
jgi:hypothetical protein